MSSNKSPDELVLYIFLRVDIPSMNNGLAAAEIAHITSDFFLNMSNERTLMGIGNFVSKWKGTNRAGNIVVLETISDHIEKVLDNPLIMEHPDPTFRMLDMAVVRDEGYPLWDGDDKHKVDKLVGFWAFGTRRAGNRHFGSIPCWNECNVY